METPYVSIVNKSKCHFIFFCKIREQEGRSCPVGVIVPVEGGRRGRRSVGG
jgi:hypothetical protein